MSFQLFPPPQKKPQINLRPLAKPASPEPALELLERAKAPIDFHELVIKVNSVPVSPASVSSPQAGQRAQTPPQQAVPIVAVPEPAKRKSPTTSPKTAVRNPSRGPTTPPLNTNVPPATGTCSSSRQSPASGKTTSPISRLDRQTTASPSFSDSTTLVRSNSAATHQTRTSPREAPVMRSIFPRYNPNLPLSQQQYKPTQTSPTHIPKEKISKQPYSPEFYIPHSNISQGSISETPYYTPKRELEHLWNAANGKPSSGSKRTFSLQMHRNDAIATSASSSSPNTTLAFGPSPAQPMYSLKQSDADTTDSTASQAQLPDQELLITRHHPTQSRSPSFPVAHLTLNIPPPHSPVDKPESFYQDTSPTLITAIHPKLASLAALDAAAQSPRASCIALADPDASSEAAAHLAAEAVAQSEAQDSSILVYCPVYEQLVEPYATNKAGTYELRHPQLGAFPVVVQGNVRRDLEAESRTPGTRGSNGDSSNAACITMLNPFAAPRSTPASSSKPTSFTSAPDTASTTSSKAPQAQSPAQSKQSADEVLARISFATNTLTLDVAAISALGNPYLIDVAVSAILAVCVAESRRDSVMLPSSDSSSSSVGRGSPQLEFAGPPKAAVKAKPGPTAKHQHWYGKSQPGKNKTKGKKKLGDLEAGYGGGVAEEDGLPWVARTILKVLGFAFKTIVFILSVGVKIIARLVVGASKVVSKA